MPSIEYAYSFGAVTASTVAQFSIMDTFKGNASVPWNARITYAIVRNNTAGNVTVNNAHGQSVVGIGERKRIEFPYGTKFFTVLPAATVTAGDLTADVGMDGVTL